MEYKSKYMADYYEEQEPKEFVIVQEVMVLKHYTVEAESMVDAIQQIEHGIMIASLTKTKSVRNTTKKGGLFPYG